jgi:hypothetical protein
MCALQSERAVATISTSVCEIAGARSAISLHNISARSITRKPCFAEVNHGGAMVENTLRHLDTVWALFEPGSGAWSFFAPLVKIIIPNAALRVAVSLASLAHESEVAKRLANASSYLVALVPAPLRPLATSPRARRR